MSRRTTISPGPWLGLETLEPRVLLAAVITGEEMAFIYALNRARHDPVAYENEAGITDDLSGVPIRPPLAVNDQLGSSARFHADEMATHNYFGHQSDVTGDYPNKMVRDQGYPLTGSWSDNSNQVESIAAGTHITEGTEALALLIEDAGLVPPSHRYHLFGMSWFNWPNREIGVGHGYSASSTYKNYWAAHLAYSQDTDTFLTGVAFRDQNGNDRYDAGEGLPGVTIAAGALNTTTNAAGGWAIQVPNPNGSYTVTASGGGFQGAGIAEVNMAGQNVEVDFISGLSGSYVDFQLYTPPPQPNLLIAPPDDTDIQAILGETVNVNVVAQNLGTGSTGATFDVGLYLSTNATVTTGDTRVGGFVSPALADGASYGQVISFAAPGTQGTYYLAALADTGDVVDEISEDDNWGQVITLDVVRGPDLVVPGADYTAGLYNPGNSMGDLTYQYMSQETVLGLAGTSVRFEARLSTDTTWGNADDVIIMTDTITWPASLGTGQVDDADAPAAVPQGAANGSYYVAVMIDADGAVSESEEGNNVWWSAAADVTVTTDQLLGGRRKAVFTDANGDVVTISLGGKAGSGVVHIPPGGGDATGITLTGTDPKSSLKVKVKKAGGGDGRTSIGDIIVGTAQDPASLKSISGKTADLAANLTVTGTLAKLQLGNVADDHTISIGARPPGDTRTALAVKLGRIVDTVFTSLMPIKSFTAIEWLDTNAVEDWLRAPWVGKLSTKGDRKKAISGHFQAGLDLDGTGAKKSTLGSAKIAGDLAGCMWGIIGSMGKLTVKGSAVGSTVRSTGAMAGITLGAANGSDFLAGIKDSVARRAQDAGDFQDLTAGIKKFKIKGLKKQPVQQRWFVDSNISAAYIGSVSLLNVEFPNGGTAFGVWACDTGPKLEIKSVKWSDKADKSNKGKWPPKKNQTVFLPPDLAIEML